MATTSMAWLVPDVPGDLAATTVARGNFDILCGGTEMPLWRQFATFLPWQAGPTPDSCVVSYSAAASVVWAAMKCDDDSDAYNDAISVTVLTPSAMQNAADKLNEQGFQFAQPAKDWADAVTRVRTFVNDKTNDEYLIDASKLDKVDPGPVNAMAAQFRFTNDIILGAFAADSDGSMMALTMFEVATTPRLQLAQRNDSKLPFLRTCAQLERHIKVHNIDVASMLAAKDKVEDIRERIAELIPEVLATSTCPLAMMMPVYTKMHGLCQKRVKIMSTLTEWCFKPSARADMVTQHFKALVGQHEYLSKVLLPCATSEECFQLASVLKNAIRPSLQITDVVALSSLDDEVKSAGLVPLVDTDERRHKPGQEKVQLVVKEARASAVSLVTPTTPAAASTTLHTSTPSKSALSMETAAWLLTEPVQTLEAKVMAAVESEDFQAAVDAIGRSKFPLYLQLLVNRDSLGSSEVAKNAKSLRNYRTAAFSFAITAEADDNDNLVQTDKDASYTVLNKFDTTFWSWEWEALDPFALIFDIQKHRIGESRASLMMHCDEFMYGDIAANRAAAEYMDRAYYSVGFTNGVFTNFMAPANKVLEMAKGIHADDFKTVRRGVTAAVKRGLTDAGADMKAAMSTSTHKKKFPQDGSRLLQLKESPYQKMLDAITQQLTAMTNTDFWQDRRKKEIEAQEAAKSQSDVIKQLGESPASPH